MQESEAVKNKTRLAVSKIKHYGHEKEGFFFSLIVFGSLEKKEIEVTDRRFGL